MKKIDAEFKVVLTEADEEEYDEFLRALMAMNACWNRTSYREYEEEEE